MFLLLVTKNFNSKRPIRNDLLNLNHSVNNFKLFELNTKNKKIKPSESKINNFFKRPSTEEDKTIFLKNTQFHLILWNNVKIKKLKN